MKITASTRVAILEAFVSKPQVIMQAPRKLLPRYPAGRVQMGIPPDIRVAPLAGRLEARSTNRAIHTPSSATGNYFSILYHNQRNIKLTIELDRMDPRACQDANDGVAELKYRSASIIEQVISNIYLMQRNSE